MKTLKIIGSAFLFLLLMTGTGFADSDAEELEEANARMKNLYNELKESKPKFDIKIADLLGKSSSDVDDINKANQLIRSLETAIQKISPSTSCLKNRPHDAETECPFYADFYLGLELIGSNEFAKSFPRAGLRLRSRLMDYEDGRGGIHFYTNFGITSRNVQNPDSNDGAVEGSRAIEGEGGFLVDIKPLSSAQNRIAFLGLLGFDSVEDIPIDPAVTNPDGPSDIFQHHFAGFRIYHTATDKYNGAYADIGWGVSENFQDNEAKRFKFRGYLPVKITKGDSTKKFFVAVEVDSDFGDGEDEIKLIFGLSVQFKQILNTLSLGILSGD